MRDSKFDKTVGWSAQIVSAYISRNSLAPSELPTLIGSVHAALRSLSGARPALVPGEPLKPAVPIRKSVSDDFIICLEDGRRFKSLKRHLRVRYNMTPEQYRIRWHLPHEYPMVAPGYAETRSKMAKSMGLGQQRRPLKRK
jgi:predicted transcriptional regulator